MEIFKFVAWVWLKNMNKYDRQLAYLIVWTLTSPVVCWFITHSIIASGAALVLSFLCGFLLLVLAEKVSEKWHQYKRVKAREAQSIIDALRGGPRY